jgi:hypothetical protein
VQIIFTFLPFCLNFFFLCKRVSILWKTAGVHRVSVMFRWSPGTEIGDSIQTICFSCHYFSHGGTSFTINQYPSNYEGFMTDNRKHHQNKKSVEKNVLLLERPVCSAKNVSQEIMAWTFWLSIEITLEIIKIIRQTEIDEIKPNKIWSKVNGK